MKYIKTFLFAVMGGILVGIGGAAYLGCENKIVASVMFAVGLFTICIFGFNLYTGKVGYILDNKPNYFIDLLLVWLGNFAGTYLVAFSLLLTRQSVIQEKSRIMCDMKINDTPLSILVLAIFCGILIYIAVEGYKKIQDSGKYIALFLCIAAFIFAGFEHCVANMFYFSLSNIWSWKALWYICLMTIGNTIGGMLIPLFKKLK